MLVLVIEYNFRLVKIGATKDYASTARVEDQPAIDSWN